MESPKTKYFPIKTATACQSKWAWSTIWINKGASASCHRVDPTPFDYEDFDNFHNLPKKLDDRRLMLEGNGPQVDVNTVKRSKTMVGLVIVNTILISQI
jgi:hypothetical protein